MNPRDNDRPSHEGMDRQSRLSTNLTRNILIVGSPAGKEASAMRMFAHMPKLYSLKVNWTEKDVLLSSMEKHTALRSTVPEPGMDILWAGVKSRLDSAESGGIRTKFQNAN